MKKSLLFLALPLVMTLASCGSESKANFKAIQEDTLAHEEIFGKASAFKAFSPIKKNADEVPDYVNVGVQSRSDENYYYIRFVAEVERVAELNTFTWYTAIYSNATGSAIKSEQELKPSGYYEQVANGGDIWTAGEGNGLFVYTLLNIPKANAADYLTARFVLENSMGTTQTTELYVTSLNEATKFSFARGKTGYFGLKKTEAGISVFEKSDFTGTNNHAQFENIQINAGESFLLVNKEENKFQVFGYSNVYAGNSSTTFQRDGSSEFAKSTENKPYFLYLSSNGEDDGKIYTQYAKTFYLKPNSNWLKDNARFALYTRESEEKWYSMKKIDDVNNIYSCAAAYSDHLLLIFCRMNPAVTDNNWNEGVKRNQSGDINWKNTDTNDYLELDADAWGGASTWKQYNA